MSWGSGPGESGIAREAAPYPNRFELLRTQQPSLTRFAVALLLMPRACQLLVCRRYAARWRSFKAVASSYKNQCLSSEHKPRPWQNQV